MNLKLTKPIVFFDIETTGLNIAKDRIIQLSYIKVFPDGHDERDTLLINPEMPISAEAREVHHISDDMVAGKPTFKQVAAKLKEVFKGSDLAGFNSNRFDIPVLVEEFLRVNMNFDPSMHNFIDVQVIYHKNEKRDLEAAYRFYCGKEMENHHSADDDTYTTYEVFKAQLDHYQLMDKSIEQLSKEYSGYNRNVDFAGRFIYNDKDQAVINFGKHKGRLASEVFATDLGYYGWIMNGDFTLDTKRKATLIKMGEIK